MNNANQILEKNTLYGYTLTGVIRNSRLSGPQKSRTALIITDILDDIAECISCTITDSSLEEISLDEIIKDIDLGLLAFVGDVPKSHIKQLKKSLLQKL